MEHSSNDMGKVCPPWRGRRRQEPIDRLPRSRYYHVRLFALEPLGGVGEGRNPSISFPDRKDIFFVSLRAPSNTSVASWKISKIEAR